MISRGRLGRATRDLWVLRVMLSSIPTFRDSVHQLQQYMDTKQTLHSHHQLLIDLNSPDVYRLAYRTKA